MANLSQKKRQRMLDFLEDIKKKCTDEESIIAINEIENELVEKKYGLVWEKHEENVDVQMRENILVFSEDKEREIVMDSSNETFNFLLEGDNLHSLKLLEKTHKGKVDVIYIDPPYNTESKDFKYDDTFVDINDSFKHSKWCSFMYERLVIARKLLKDSGAIFISIDDDEQAALKFICDEIFGMENFVANVIWEKKFSPQNDAKWLSDNHDFIIIYAKNKCIWKPNLLERTNEMNARYKNPDNDPRGVWTSGDFSVKTYNESADYPITTPSGRVVNPPAGYSWRFSRESYLKMLADNRVWFGENGNNVPRVKRFLSEVKQGTVCKTIWEREDVGDTQEGTRDMKAVFGGQAPFTNPKPVRLLKRILELATDENSIVLDFFAGSGTTAQAVIEYNKVHGGNRKFILCTDNSVSDKERKVFLNKMNVTDVAECSTDWKAYLEENGICRAVTYKRIMNVIQGYESSDTEEKNVGIVEKKRLADNNGSPINLKYYKTELVAKTKDDFYSIGEELTKHIKEMIQLEWAISIDNEKYFMILSDEEADELEKTPERITNCKAIYIAGNVLLTASQVRLFENVALITIPDYYFEEEMREVGEL